MEASEEEEELHEMKETATMLSSLSVAALDPDSDGKSELPLTPAILEVDLTDRSRSSSRPPPSSSSYNPPPLPSFHRRGGHRNSRKFSLGNLSNISWPCRDMTNFHCYLMMGLIAFFIFWLLLLLRIYLPSDYFEDSDPTEVVPENGTEQEHVLNETTTDTNSTEEVVT